MKFFPVIPGSCCLKSLEDCLENEYIDQKNKENVSGHDYYYVDRTLSEHSARRASVGRFGARSPVGQT